VQGLLGPEAVRTPVLDGGRGPTERVRLVPWGERREPHHPTDAPWPGHLPAPNPSLVYTEPVPAALTDTTGDPVTTTIRTGLSAAPHTLTIGRDQYRVVQWSGPWRHDTDWPPHPDTRGRVRLQVTAVPAGHSEPQIALLIASSDLGMSWTVEGRYD
ncbi:DNA polymerase Y family protein, partial [Amycolatopsis magusensis]